MKKEVNIASEWLAGRVVPGYHNGTVFGFPTANIALEVPTVIEKGVYAVCVRARGLHYGGMMYVGTRPTLQLEAFTIEIHLFGFKGDLYGEDILFRIVGKIREEHQFESTEALIRQLSADKITALEMLAHGETGI